MKREIKTTLALDGEKKFKKEMADAGRQLKVLSSEMKANTALFKGNENSMESLTAQGKIFEKQVAQQKEIVEALGRAVKESAEKYGEADKRTDGYRISLNNATAALAKMERELDQNSQAMSELSQDTERAASKLGKLKASAREASDSLKKTGDKLKGIGQGMSVGVTAPIVGGFFALSEGTREFRGDLARLETNAKTAGQSMKPLDDAMAKMFAVTGETDSNVEGLSNVLATGFKGEKLTQLVDAMAGASIKFSDTLKFEGIADGLQETLATGAAIGPFSELIDRVGIGVDAFNEGLTEAIATGREQEYVLETLSKAGLPGVYDEYRKSNKAMVDAAEAQYRMQQAMADMGTSVEPIITPIITKITELANVFNNMSPTGQKTVMVVAGIAAAIGPLLMGLGLAAQGLGSVGKVGGGIIKFLPKLAGAFTLITGPVGIAIVAIAALIGIGVALYKNWDKITAKAAELKEKAGASIDGMKDRVGKGLESIKGFFTRLKLPEIKIPKIKLPHFDIKGKFSLSPPQVPKLDVNWYKNGAIFNGPSVIGVGEAGPEAAIPLDKLEGIIAKAMKSAGGMTTVNHTGTVIHRGVSNAGELVAAVKQEFVKDLSHDNRRIPNRVSIIPIG